MVVTVSVLFSDFSLMHCFHNKATDDTCTQPGYWGAVAEFIASLKKDIPEKSPRNAL